MRSPARLKRLSRRAPSVDSCEVRNLVTCPSLIYPQCAPAQGGRGLHTVDGLPRTRRGVRPLPNPAETR